jgi:hypothetical protein
MAGAAPASCIPHSRLQGRRSTRGNYPQRTVRSPRTPFRRVSTPTAPPGRTSVPDAPPVPRKVCPTRAVLHEGASQVAPSGPAVDDGARQGARSAGPARVQQTPRPRECERGESRPRGARFHRALDSIACEARPRDRPAASLASVFVVRLAARGRTVPLAKSSSGRVYAAPCGPEFYRTFTPAVARRDRKKRRSSRRQTAACPVRAGDRALLPPPRP